MEITNANNFQITPLITMIALTKSGLRWRVSPAMSVAIEAFFIVAPVQLTRVVTEDCDKLEITPTTRLMCGIPYSVSDDMPAGTIELRLGNQVLGKIENIAIPYGM